MPIPKFALEQIQMLAMLGIKPETFEKYQKVEVKSPKAGKNEILIYGPIVDDFLAEMYNEAFESQIFTSGATVKKALDALGDDVTEIMLRFKTPGGSGWEADAILNMLQERVDAGVTINGIIDGICASAGTVIMMICEHIKAGPLASIMIHEANMFVYDNKQGLKKAYDFLEKFDSQMIKLYVKRTGKPEKEVTEKVEAETWFSTPEAIEFGLVDEETEIGKNDDKDAQAFAERRKTRLAMMGMGLPYAPDGSIIYFK